MMSGEEHTAHTSQLDWWECAMCGETGNSGIRECPSCGSMQIDNYEGGVDLPPCWKEDPALASQLGVQRLWLHLDGPGFIGLRDGNAELVRADLRKFEDADPETRPGTAESVRELAEEYNNEVYTGDSDE